MYLLSSDSSNGNIPLDQVELRGGGLSQAWKSNRPSMVRQVSGDPAADGDAGGAASLAEQSVMVVGRLGAQGAWRAGLQESKVAAGKQLCSPRPP